jgi:hypothetical protein
MRIMRREAVTGPQGTCGAFFSTNFVMFGRKKRRREMRKLIRAPAHE